MGQIIFNGLKTKYNVIIKQSKTQQGGHAVEVIFTDTDPKVSTKGFIYFGEDGEQLADYSTYVTVYRQGYEQDRYMLSDDGTVYVEPTVKCTTYFGTDGGILHGELKQTVSDYSELVVPTPVSDENWQFVNWDISIPTEGIITASQRFTAHFEYIGTPPVQEPTIEGRLESAETDIADTQTGLAEVYEMVSGGA